MARSAARHPVDAVEEFRPRLARIAGWAGAVIALVAMAAVAAVLPSAFSIVDRVAFVAVGAAGAAFCVKEAMVRVTARPDRLEVRNLIGSRDLEWAEVVAVSFPEGDPWAHLDLADGDTLAMMALQRADGPAGIAAARRLAELVRERGEVSGPQG